MIEMNDVEKTYSRGAEELHVLKNVNLHIKASDFVAIVGPSGSGKSTLMNMIGLLDVPTKGSYLLDGVSTSGLSDNKMAELRNHKIGFIFQQFNLLPRLTALENVELPLIYGGASPQERRETAMDMLESLGMKERAKHLPSELSGGQQQRVAIARALVSKPSLLLADEPTGALDSRTGQEVLELMLELNSRGNTIVLITHDQAIARNASRIISIRDGELISDHRNEDKQLRIQQTAGKEAMVE